MDWQIYLALTVAWIVTISAAYFVGFWRGERASAESYAEMRNYYNQGYSNQHRP
jgi:hypothetical protein